MIYFYYVTLKVFDQENILERNERVFTFTCICQREIMNSADLTSICDMLSITTSCT